MLSRHQTTRLALPLKRQLFYRFGAIHKLITDVRYRDSVSNQVLQILRPSLIEFVGNAQHSSHSLDSRQETPIIRSPVTFKALVLSSGSRQKLMAVFGSDFAKLNRLAIVSTWKQGRYHRVMVKV